MLTTLIALLHHLKVFLLATCVIYLRKIMFPCVTSGNILLSYALLFFPTFSYLLSVFFIKKLFPIKHSRVIFYYTLWSEKILLDQGKIKGKCQRNEHLKSAAILL